MPGSCNRLLGLAHQSIDRAESARQVDRPGLAEAASARASAHDFESDAGVHRVDERNDLTGGEGRRLQVWSEASPDASGCTVRRGDASDWARSLAGGMVEGRYVNALYRGQRLERLRTVSESRRFRDLEDCLLPFPDQEGVEEVGHWLGIHRAGPTPDDQRMVRGAIGRPHRKAAQIQHVQDVGIGQLVRQSETDDIELAERSPRFEARKRHPACPELLLHVGPRREHPLGHEIRMAVQHVVQDMQAEVRHPDLISVGIGQHEARASGTRILLHRVPLAADVPRGLRDPRKYGVVR